MLPRLAAKVKWETGRPFLGREERAGQGGSGDGGRPAWKIRQRQRRRKGRAWLLTESVCSEGSQVTQASGWRSGVWWPSASVGDWRKAADRVGRDEVRSDMSKLRCLGDVSPTSSSKHRFGLSWKALGGAWFGSDGVGGAVEAV